MTRLGWWILLAATAVLSLSLYGAEQRRRGAAEAEGARWKQELDSLRVVARRVDTLYRTDTVRLWRLRERWDTAVVHVEKWKTDTVEVVRYVQLADSTIRACTAALLTCEERVAVRDRQLVAWERRWETREQPPSALLRWAERVLFFAAGRASAR